MITRDTADFLGKIHSRISPKFYLQAGRELQDFVNQIDQDKDLKDSELEKVGRDMVYSFCYEQEDRFGKIESLETGRIAALIGAWSGLTMAFVTLVAVILILVLLAIERNTRRA